MVFDVAADGISDTRLSQDYNILTIACAAIAPAAAPGQFVMVKPDGMAEPLLRRPFSIFEILRNGGGAAGVSLMNKRIGRGTSLLYDARPGDRISCLGPLGQPFVPVDPPAQGWMI